MTLRLAQQAREVGLRPESSPAELFKALGELMAFGDVDAAETIILRLKAAGHYLYTIGRFHEFIKWVRAAGPPYLESFLAGSLAVVEDAEAGTEQLLKAAENLIAWGSLDEADRALERLSGAAHLRGPVSRLASASRQLRRGGLLRSLESLPPSASLNRPYEVLISRRQRPVRRTVVVFTGIAWRFWLTLNALDQYLKRLGANIIYLNDHSVLMYVNGLASIGDGYAAMVRMVRDRITELGSPETYVLATSAGGFVGLRAAIDLEAESFVGLSIRTSLLETETLPLSGYERHAVAACRDPGMLMDLRPLIEASSFPRRIELFAGDLAAIDRAHAENLAGIDRVKVHFLSGYGAHDTVSGLISRGQFEPMLRRFVGLDEQAPAGRPRADAAG